MNEVRKDWFGVPRIEDAETTVYKYGTGAVVPPNAVYLTSFVQEGSDPMCGPFRWVWHYFRVPV